MLQKISVLATVTFCLLSCKARDFNKDLSATKAGEALQSVAELTQDEYMTACQKEVGPIPSNMSCVDPVNSRELYIWKSVPGSVAQRVGYELPNSADSCDNPSSIGKTGACDPYSRLVTHKKGDVTWTALCRSGSSTLIEGKPVFDQIGMIGHNSQNGATCFFERNTDRGRIDGSRIPTPANEVAFWLTPKAMATRAGSRCVSCHTPYPFITNPFVLGVSPHMPDAKTKIPELITSFPRNNLKGPYYVVKMEHLNGMSKEDSFAGKNSWTPLSLVGDKGRACVGCHRLSNDKSSLKRAQVFSDTSKLEKQGFGKYSESMTAFPTYNLHWSLVQLYSSPAPNNLPNIFSTVEEWQGSHFFTSLKELEKNCGGWVSSCQGAPTK